MLLVVGAVLVLTLVLASFVSGVMTHAALDSYETTDQLFLERRLSKVVSRWHDDHRGWDRLDAAVTQIGPALGRRVVILDEGGDVVADSYRMRPDHETAKHTVPAMKISESTPISGGGGETIGYLLIPEPPDEQYAPPGFSIIQRSVTRSLLIGGVAAGLVGVLLVGLMANRTLAPVRQLSATALRFGRGNLSERVPVTGPTERRGLVVAFNTMADDLERSDSQRRNMTADVAHELRTPLSNIRGYLEAIKDGVVPADSATIDTLHQQSLHLSELVDDLALLASAEAGALTLNVQEVEVGPMLKDAVDAFQPRARADGVNLSLDVSDALPAVSIDPIRVRQIIGNLVDNAITHTPSGGTVAVVAEVISGDPDGVRGVNVSVTDTGNGIPPDELGQIFERFYRVDLSAVAGDRGSGTGTDDCQSTGGCAGRAIDRGKQAGRGQQFHANSVGGRWRTIRPGRADQAVIRTISLWTGDEA